MEEDTSQLCLGLDFFGLFQPHFPLCSCSQQFKKNLKGVNGNKDFEQDMLEDIYTAIKYAPSHTSTDLCHG